MCAVPSAPGAASLRVWEVMSRDGATSEVTARRRALMLAILILDPYPWSAPLEDARLKPK